MGQILLSVRGITKRYGNLIAVDDMSFSVNKGEVFGLLGPNGAGKTTTIKMLCGLLKADSGNIEFDGRSISKRDRQMKTMIGLCPQEIIIWDMLTCLEQLVFVGMSYGLSSQKAYNRAETLLENLGLAEQRNRMARTLSGGLKRRLNIALALVHDPLLVILDEPQAGLDPQGRILVRDYIRHLAEDRTVILTTHDMDEADRISDRVCIIDHGKVLLIDTPEKIKRKSGGGEVLQIRVNGIDSNLADQVLSAMPPGLTKKIYSDGLFLLCANEILELIPQVNMTLQAFDIPIEDMTIRKNTLEDAFIAMTGRGRLS